jgi:hypothetical protein
MLRTGLGVVLITTLIGCASIHVPAQLGPSGCLADRALIGTWSDARLTQVGPVWERVTFTPDCRVHFRAQLLFFRVNKESQFVTAQGHIVIAESGGRERRVPYRIDGDRLWWTDAPGEVITYQRR